MKKFKRTASVMLAVLMVLSLMACGEKKASSPDIDGIIKEFEEFTKIPRPSHHEEKISAYLVNWAKENGYEAKTDEVGNVCFDVPATKGFESRPLTILQGHMDMVVTVKDGKQFDPLNDGITMKNDGEYLSADGTSLGADDGIGDAIILYTIKNCKEHGPLRIIITVDEEDDFTGISNVGMDWLEGVKNVINLDNECANNVAVSCAGGSRVVYTSSLNRTSPKLNKALELKITGLLGGHSGEMINDGHLNAIIGMSQVLSNLRLEKVDFELASFTGGEAENAIPSTAVATIVVGNDVEKAKNVINDAWSELKSQYGKVETGMQIDITETTMPEQVMNKATAGQVIDFVKGIKNGAHELFDNGNVKTSSNIGILKATEEFEACVFIRSNEVEKLAEFTTEFKNYAKRFQVNVIKASAEDKGTPWDYNPNSALLKLTKESYKALENKEMVEEMSHGILECGELIKQKADLDIISIGPDVTAPHSINETCKISSIQRTYNLLVEILKKI